MGSAGSRVPDTAIMRAPEMISLQDAGTGQTNAALDVLRSLPPEAIIKVVDIIGDIVRARAAMSRKHADFLAELEILRSKSGARERALALLSDLLLNAEINDEAKMKLVDTICQFALR